MKLYEELKEPTELNYIITPQKLHEIRAPYKRRKLFAINSWWKNTKKYLLESENRIIVIGISAFFVVYIGSLSLCHYIDWKHKQSFTSPDYQR